MQLATSKYYIAVLGNNQPDILIKEAKPIVMLNTTSQAIEVYETPFEAFAGLNKNERIKPESIVTLYETDVHNDHIVHLKKCNDTHEYVLATIDLVFRKKGEEVLGAIVKYL